MAPHAEFTRLNGESNGVDSLSSHQNGSISSQIYQQEQRKSLLFPQGPQLRQIECESSAWRRGFLADSQQRINHPSFPDLIPVKIMISFASALDRPPLRSLLLFTMLWNSMSSSVSPVCAFLSVSLSSHGTQVCKSRARRCR